jgi:hypothetical protein
MVGPLFPLLMYMRGCRLYQTEPSVLHLNHTERWSEPVWRDLGLRFVDEIAFHAGVIYKSNLDGAIKRRTGRLMSDLRYNLSARLPKNAAYEPGRMLGLISDLNISFLDQLSRQYADARLEKSRPDGL